MNNFKRVSAAVSAGMTLLCASGASYSLGFGQPSSRAILGDTLRVTIPLRLEAGEEIANECMAADVYFGDEKVQAKAIFTEVMPGATPERAVLRVSTSALINEPVVTVYLAAGCKSRITRKVVALADPPGLSMAGNESAASADVGEAVQAASLPVAQVVSPPGVLSAAMAAGQSGRAGASKRHGGKPVDAASPLAKAPSLVVNHVLASSETAGVATSSGATSAASSSSKRRATKSGAKAPAGQDGGARLLLDPVETDAMFVPSLRMSPTMGSAVSAEDQSPDVLLRRQAAAALWLAMNATPEQLARDHQRLQDLEQRLAQLKHDGEKSREVIAALQVRASKAEAARGGVWLYGIGLLAFAGLALSGYLYNRLRLERKRQAAWWQAQSQLSDEELADDSEPFKAQGARPGAPASSERQEPLSVAASAYAEPVREAAVTAANIHQHVPDVAPAGMHLSPLVEPRNEPLREVSVEELIDLEQQAEFFVVLGQDDAAIDLLEGHVHHTTGASPLPFLKLLEIYRRVGKRADYERIQAEFNERFNAYAPAWDADLQQGHSLADYPGVIDRLQALWASPTKAMEVLERSLTRPDSSEDTFELPAYRELLFLYAVARDLAERDTGGRDSVDLLLPVTDVSGVAPPEPVRHNAIIEPLMATRPIKAQPEVSPSISLDLHLDDLQAPEPPDRQG